MRVASVPLLALLLLPPAARADIAPEPLSGGTQLGAPGGEITSVQLRQGTVTIEVRADRWETRATFVLVNSDEPATLEVGFPYSYPGELEGFIATVDGRPAQVTEGASPDPRYRYRHTLYWKIWTMSFEPGATHRVEVSCHGSRWRSYDLLQLNPDLSPWYAGEEGALVDAQFEQRSVVYPLWSGATWRDDVKRMRIIVRFLDLSPAHVRSAFPPGYIEARRGLLWDLRDVDPAGGVRVDFLPGQRAAELPDALERLHRRHSEDPFLATIVSTRLDELGLRERAHAVRHATLATWSGKVPDLFPAEPPPTRSDARFFAFWRLATHLLLVYDRDGEETRTSEIAPVVARMATELGRQLEAAGRAREYKKHQLNEARRFLDLAKRHLHP